MKIQKMSLLQRLLKIVKLQIDRDPNYKITNFQGLKTKKKLTKNKNEKKHKYTGTKNKKNIKTKI